MSIAERPVRAKIIYKYPFNSPTLIIPEGKILLVGHQDGSGMPTVWVQHIVDDDNQLVSQRHIRLDIVPTGQSFMFGTQPEHIGSAICNAFVWHVYKREGTW